MSDAAISDAAVARPLTVRMRPDLEVQQQQFGDRPGYVLKDPWSRRFYFLGEEEFGILKLVDGRRSMDQIQQDFQARFPPTRLSIPRLEGFVAHLYREGLMLADSPGQAEPLLDRQRRSATSTARQRWMNPLAIRFRGFDPDDLLERLLPCCRWIFSPLTIAAGLGLVAWAALLITVQFNVLLAELPAFELFFSLQNAPWILLALCITKVIHELAHGMTCKFFGGECHELGVMLLVFTPCLYCDVSDAWLVRGRWRRAAIAGAGIIVELVIASACSIIWWFTNEGVLNTLCLATMFTCGVSTVVFNGNPLLRYDGYFILSDLLDSPNLWQQSRDVVRRWLARICLGLKPVDAKLQIDSRTGLLVLYAATSMVYRVVVLVAIGFFLLRLFELYRIAIVGRVLVAVAGFGVVAVPVARGWRNMRNPIVRRGIVRSRLVVTLAALGAALVGVCFIPVQFRVSAPMILETADAQHVYVRVGGTLTDSVQVGSRVRSGDTIAVLENFELRREVADLSGQVEEQEVRLRVLESARSGNPVASSRIPAAREKLRDLRERFEQRSDDLRKLTLVANRAGTILSVPPRPELPTNAENLREWSGTPLDGRNKGVFLEAGVAVCFVGDPRDVEAVAFVDQADVPFIKPGQSARIQVGAARIVSGKVMEIARIDSRVVPRELDPAELHAEVDREGIRRPQDTLYQVRVGLDTNRPLVHRVAGRLKIDAGNQTLGWRLRRYLARTFRFEL